MDCTYVRIKRIKTGKKQDKRFKLGQTKRDVSIKMNRWTFEKISMVKQMQKM